MDAKHWNGEPEAEHDPNAGGYGEPYICRDCSWTGRGGVEAFNHYRSSEDTHRIRGRNWPESWGDADFPVYNFEKQQQEERQAKTRRSA